MKYGKRKILNQILKIYFKIHCTEKTKECKNYEHLFLITMHRKNVFLYSIIFTTSTTIIYSIIILITYGKI